MIIEQAGAVVHAPTFDTPFHSSGVIAFPASVSGTETVEVVLESKETIILPVDIIRQLFCKCTQINSAGTTVLPADIWIGFQ
jgi:hypothetical protein